MVATETIYVGQNPEAEYVAFGDDSKYGDYLAYAFIIVHKARIKFTEARISALKERYKIPADIPLHCKMLFHKTPRDEAGLTHLTKDHVRSIFTKAITIVNQSKIILRFSTTTLSAFRTSTGDKITLTNTDKTSEVTLAVKSDPKGVLGMLMQRCLIVPPDGSYGPQPSECEIITSEDSTMIKFIGDNRRRADSHYSSGFSDIGAPSNTVFQLQPKIIKAKESILLQLADIAAYMCSHSCDKSPENLFFREQLSRIRLWSSLN